ncbi:arrestin homolog [Ischnura elegans]|uniref:arrestin homolog n=1 Tax=Ischnura elegans TaxID=197161 RepID=UPI001ED8776A|nr:arrestin homolog [Ischnura elegans]
MIPFLFLVFVVAVKVFKKSTPNGKLTVYLGKRDFVDHLDHIDPIDGVVVVESDYLRGRKVFGQVTATYRFGREEDEVMGVKFSKEMVVANGQMVPQKDSERELTPIQERLMKKFGANATPFTFKFPQNAPSSVMLQTVGDETGKPLGVEYSFRTYVGEHSNDRTHKRSTVTFAIKKIQYSPPSRGNRLPSSLASKGFTFSQGKINLEVTLDKEIYYHGEKVSANVIVSNNSRKAVKNMKVMIVQHCEVTMVNMQFSRVVADLETREGCPITPGASLTKTFYLVPLASSNKDKQGIALDGHLKDDDVNLASSTLVAEGLAPHEAMGIVVSYSLRVKLNCGTLGGELQTDVPFKLLHPAPGSVEQQNATAEKKAKPLAKSNDDDDNIVFEDFAHLRLTEQQ